MEKFGMYIIGIVMIFAAIISLIIAPDAGEWETIMSIGSVVLIIAGVIILVINSAYQGPKKQ